MSVSNRVAATFDIRDHINWIYYDSLHNVNVVSQIYCKSVAKVTRGYKEIEKSCFRGSLSSHPEETDMTKQWCKSEPGSAQVRVSERA